MDIKKIILLILALISSPVFAQNSKIKGFIINEQNECIQEASVKLNALNLSTVTDKSGEFVLENIPTGEYALNVSRIGYDLMQVNLKVNKDTIIKLTFVLKSSPITVGEIIVKSARYDAILKSVSIPMEVVNENEVKKSASFTVPDLLKNKSGISVTRDGIWASDVSIRGLSKNNVVVLIDGNRIETATDISARLSMVDIFDIDRIELIKGAASSLYGTGAFGGVVNIFTKNGFYNNKPYFSGSFSGSFNSVNKNGSGNISLNTGFSRAYLKVNATYRKADNTKTPNGELTNSQFEDNNISAVLGVIPFNNNELKINYQRFDAYNVGIPGAYTFFPTNAVVTYPREKRDMISVEYYSKNISGILPEISARYFYQSILRDVENIPNQVTIKPAGNGLPKQKISVLKITPNARHYTNGIQLQTDWAFAKNNYTIAGIDLWQRALDSKREKVQKIEIYDTTGTIIVQTINKITGEKPVPDAIYKSLGFYIQNEMNVIPGRLKLNIGGRIDKIIVNNNKALNPVYEITNGVLNYSPAGQKTIWNENESNNVSWSGNFGALYTFAKDFDLSLTIARSFRSPSLEERYQYIDLGSFLRIGNPDLLPEKGMYFDLGLRIWKSKINFTGDIFLNTFTNLVAEIPGTYEGKNAFIKTNIGKARYYGFDLDVTYNFYKTFILFANTAYVSGEDTENNANLPLIPPLNAKIGIKYGLNKFIFAELSSNIFAEQNKVAAGELATPGYATFDFVLYSPSIRYGIIKFQLISGVENIFDKSYRNHLSSNRGFITSEPGRNIYFKMNLSF
jgi:hemoglobin/transferrin/lactoferrin receptor protein